MGAPPGAPAAATAGADAYLGASQSRPGVPPAATAKLSCSRSTAVGWYVSAGAAATRTFLPWASNPYASSRTAPPTPGPSCSRSWGLTCSSASAQVAQLVVSQPAGQADTVAAGSSQGAEQQRVISGSLGEDARLTQPRADRRGRRVVGEVRRVELHADP